MRSLLPLLLAGLALCPVAATAQDAVTLVPDPTPGASCSVPAKDGWTRYEAWAWQQICAGRVADMQRAAGAIDTAGCDAGDETARWPDRRRLSASFVEEVSRGDVAADLPRITAVRIRCARIDSRIDLVAEEVAPFFGVQDSRIRGGVDLSDAVFRRDVSFAGSLMSADGGGFIDTVSRVGVVADGMTVAGDLHLTDMPRVGGVNLVGARIGGDVSADRSNLTGPFNADGMEVGGGLFLSDMPSVAAVRLLGAKVGGQVSTNRSTFNGLFNADGMEVGGDLFLSDMPSVAEVRLLGAKVGGDVAAVGSTFNGLFNADGMEVGGVLFLRNMEGAQDLGLRAIRVRQDVQLHGSAIAGAVNLTAAEIGGALELWQNTIEVDWREGAALILRNASAAALQARMPESWRVTGTDDPIPYDLQGFSYGRLGGNTSGAVHDLARSNDAEALVAWLQAERPPGMAALTAYGPQPYRQLAKVLRAQGAEAQADRVDFARLMHRRATRFGDTVTTWDYMVGAFRWTVDTAALVFVGFGVYPGVALGWFLLLVGAGTVVGRASPELRDRTAWTRLWYSLENALPLVEPSGRFAGITHLGPGGRSTRVANFFQFQKVMGFVLATVLVGALTLLGG